MASGKATSRKAAAGQAQFVVDAEEKALEVFLDRQGFRRLLQTLEKLAQSGDDQSFGKSGRQITKGRAKPREVVAVGKLVFRIDGSDQDERG